MMDMTGVDGDKEHFIVDIMSTPESITVYYADGSSSMDNFYTEHNMEFYRGQMEKQAKKYIDGYMKYLQDEVLRVYVLRALAIATGVIGMYLLYNFDIHYVMKFILGLILVILELGYYLYEEINLDFLSLEVREALATDYYLNHKMSFNYFDTLKNEYVDALKIEEIANKELTLDDIVEFENYILNLKKEYPGQLADIKLTLTKEENKKDNLEM